MKQNTKAKLMFLSLSAIFLIFMIVITLYTDRVEISESSQNDVFKLVNNLTKGYQIRQILSVLFLAVYGNIITDALLNEENNVYKFAISFPIAVALWVVMSCILLVIRLPYSLTSMLLFMLLFFAGIIWKVKRIHLDIYSFIIRSILHSSIICFFSTGLMPMLYTYDAYYFIMQTGDVLAFNGGIKSELCGAFLNWSGIMPATMSSFSEFFGYETFMAIHYMLVFAMIVLISYELYERLSVTYGYTKIILVFSILSGIASIFIPPFMISSLIVNSSTYTMVYLTFFLLIAERSLVNAKGSLLKKWVFIEAIFGICITMCRPEGFVLFCFLILVLSYIFKNKLLGMISLPSSILIISYILLLIFQKYSEKLAYNTRYTPRIAILYLIAVVAMIVYCALIDKLDKLVKFIPYLVIFVIPILSVSISLVINEDFVGNLKTIFTNLITGAWWGFPYVVIILFAIALTSQNITVNLFQLSFVLGYIFISFAMNMYRSEGITPNYFDSFNRNLFSVTPYILYVVYERAGNCVGNFIMENKNRGR